MARPYNRWKPEANASLVVTALQGPLVISGSDPRWPLFVRPAIEPVLYANNDWVLYLQEVNFQDDQAFEPQTGTRARGFQYMPDGMTFFGVDPSNGEPRPDDAADTHEGENFRYSTLGHRLPIRGLISNSTDSGLILDFQVKWGDSEARNSADARGAWTGAAIGIFNGGEMRSNHLAYALHGKRLGDASWEHRGSLVIDADESTGPYTPDTVVASPWDGVDAGITRILILGGPAMWTVKTQYWDPGGPAWVDLSDTDDDLKFYAVPNVEDLFGVIGFLFHGATKKYSAMPAEPPLQDTYFQEVTVPQFTPFVLDMADWTLRDREETTAWLTGAQYWLAPLYMSTPALDIITWPEGSSRGPDKIRYFDTDEELFGVKFSPTTMLQITAPSDRRFISFDTTAGNYTPVCLCDDAALGKEMPFAYVGRYKLKDLGAWPVERCLASFGTAGWAPTPSASNAGFGLTWRPDNGGELVLRIRVPASDPNWVVYAAPFRPEDYSDRLTEIGFAWTGTQGAIALKADYALRIVVDGVTIGEWVEPDALFTSGWIGTIGSGRIEDRESFPGIWYGGATYIEAVTDYELSMAFVDDEVEGFDNPSFEIAHPSGRPGEADQWDWTSLQHVGGWADFSAYRPDLAPFRYGREGFEGGWLSPYAWAYADEAARLAAVGFTADDVGHMAWQVDVNRNYVLTGHNPVSWEMSHAGENQGSVSDLAEALVAAGVFNEGIPNYDSVVEHFAIWGHVWETFTWSGPPWRDVFTFVRPCEDNLGEYDGPTGFDGWHDHVFGTNIDPLCTEMFNEAWGNDPFSTGGFSRWKSGAAPSGIIRGKAVAFPLEIPPNKNNLYIQSDYFGVIRIRLNVREFEDAESLAVELDDRLSAEIPFNAGISFGFWVDGDEQGITFGWDGTIHVAQTVYFATVLSDRFSDMRESIGLRSFGPGGSYGGVGIPVWYYDNPPSWLNADDRILVDKWSMISFATVSDNILGEVVLAYDMVGAVFDSAISENTLLEQFTLHGWISPTAEWTPDLAGFITEQAMFLYGEEEDRSGMELFDLSAWPDEPFPIA